MWKKAIPAVALCSFLLVGCNNMNKTVPSNNETPMQDIKRGVEDVTPNVNNGRDINNYNNGANGVNDGTINNGMDGTNNLQEMTPNAENKWIKEPRTKNEDIINNGTMK